MENVNKNGFNSQLLWQALYEVCLNPPSSPLSDSQEQIENASNSPSISFDVSTIVDSEDERELRRVNEQIGEHLQNVTNVFQAIVPRSSLTINPPQVNHSVSMIVEEVEEQKPIKDLMKVEVILEAEELKAPFDQKLHFLPKISFQMPMIGVQSKNPNHHRAYFYPLHWIKHKPGDKPSQGMICPSVIRNEEGSQLPVQNQHYRLDAMGRYCLIFLQPVQLDPKARIWVYKNDSVVEPVCISNISVIAQRNIFVFSINDLEDKYTGFFRSSGAYRYKSCVQLVLENGKEGMYFSQLFDMWIPQSLREVRQKNDSACTIRSYTSTKAERVSKEPQNKKSASTPTTMPSTSNPSGLPTPIMPVSSSSVRPSERINVTLSENINALNYQAYIQARLDAMYGRGSTPLASQRGVGSNPKEPMDWT